MVLGLAAGEVVLVSAHEAWAHEFQLEKARIVEIIGAQILDIQHVGSTSVPGVPAKPILDILIGVESFEGFAVCIAPLETLGYRYRGENGIPRRHFFVKGDPRTHHLHVVEKGSSGWVATVKFRDLLRSHPDSAREYAEAKSKLASRFAKDRSAYQIEKDKVVERLLEGAMDSR